MKKHFLKSILLITLLCCSSYGNVSFAIFGLTEDVWNTAIVALLGSLEALNEVGNSNTMKALGETKELTNNLKKVKETVGLIQKKYTQGKLLVKVSIEMVNVFNAYLQFITDIYKHKDLLALEELEALVTMIDYVVFNERSFDSSKSGGKSFSKGMDELGGVLAERLKNMETLLLDVSKGNDNIAVLQKAEEGVYDLYNQLRKMRSDVELMRKHAKATLLYKRYINGYYNTPEFTNYVYQSEYRKFAEMESNARKKSLINIFK